MKIVLDACVLYPTILREVLLDTAGQGLFEPVWSRRILDEWRHAAARLGHEGAMVAGAEAALAEVQFPHALVADAGQHHLHVEMPDPDDVHVVATALAAGAQIIVTANLRDFPRRAIGHFGIEAIHPDMFLTSLWAGRPEAVEAAVHGAHRKAVALGGSFDLREMMKRAVLPRLGRAMRRAAG